MRDSLNKRRSSSAEIPLSVENAARGAFLGMNDANLRAALLRHVDLYLANEISARQFEAWIVSAYEELDDNRDPELASIMIEAERRAAEATRASNQEQPLRRWLEQSTIPRLRQRATTDETIRG
jgi:hypothetical protein